MFLTFLTFKDLFKFYIYIYLVPLHICSSFVQHMHIYIILCFRSEHNLFYLKISGYEKEYQRSRR